MEILSICDSKNALFTLFPLCNGMENTKKIIKKKNGLGIYYSGIIKLYVSFSYFVAMNN